jgi:S-DNA-T family DNA segregation ATPase FtsK/SpoIIIE
MVYESAGLKEVRLLPGGLEERLVVWAQRLIGCIVLVVCAAGALSLLTWSVADPSLTNATSGATHNLLGPLGAIVSDLLLQTLGLAGAGMVLPPTFWALHLVLTAPLVSVRRKLLVAPFAVWLLAIGLSALPTPIIWPLRHGFGGMLGDVGLALIASLVVVLNPPHATTVAGLFCFVFGISLLAVSVDLSGDGPADGPAQGRRGRPKLALRPTGFANSPLWMPELNTSGPAPNLKLKTKAQLRPDNVSPFAHDCPSLDNSAAGSPSDASQACPAADFLPDLDPDFDVTTEGGSREIAKRFAPLAAEAVRAEANPRPVAGSLLTRLNGLRRSSSHYKQYPLTMLRRPKSGRPETEESQQVLRGNARMLEDVLCDFGIKGEVKNIRPGPIVTLFEFEPARGTKSSRVIGLAEDIARSMSVSAARVAVVPGRNAIGIELPNVHRETVSLRELLESEAFRASDAALPLALGNGIGGEPCVTDLARMPHLLVAGTTGSGKSVGINVMILSLLYRLSPEQCRFLMIDPKMLELSTYNGIPHLLTPVVTDPQKAIAALNWVVGEMEERYKRMAKINVRNINAFNTRVRDAEKHGGKLSRTVQVGFDRDSGQAIYEMEELAFEPMPYIIVVVDEFADLMIVAGKDIESAVQRLAQMARAAGIHLIMATQRPSVDIITGTIKANFPARIGFKVTSKIDSRTILNEQGAEQLLGQGDMLYSNGGGQIVRLHGPFVSDEEVESIVAYLRRQGEPTYVEGVTDFLPASETADDGTDISDDDLYDRAVAIVRRDKKASISYLQRRLSIGYNRAASLIERMESEGIVGQANHTGKRQMMVQDDAVDSAQS